MSGNRRITFVYELIGKEDIESQHLDTKQEKEYEETNYKGLFILCVVIFLVCNSEIAL